MPSPDRRIESAPDATAGPKAYLRCDVSFVVAEESASAKEIFGATDTSLVGFNFVSLLAPESRARVLQLIASTNSSGPVSFQRLDGGRSTALVSITFEDSAWVVRIFEEACPPDQAGETGGPAAGPSETAWRLAAEAAEHGVWEIAIRNGKRVHAKVWTQIHGIAADRAIELGDKALEARIHPDDVANFREALERYRAFPPEVVQFEYRIRSDDGRWIWLQSRGRAVEWGEAGEPIRITGTDTDISALKQAEQKVGVLSQRLELALATSGVAVWEVDLDDMTFTCDESLAAIYGFTVDEKLSLSAFLERVHPDDMARTVARVREAIENESGLENHFRIYRMDGSLRHVTTLGVVHRGVDGKLRLLGVDRDITEVVEREEELVRQNRLFENAMANMVHGFSMFDARGRLIVANERYSEIYHLPAEVAVPGVHVKQIKEHMIRTGLLTSEMVEDKLAATFGSPEQGKEAIWHLGSGRVIAFSIVPLKEGGWISVHRDITEQYKAETELAISEQRFREFTATASDWCWETDADHRLTFVTDSFEAHTGVPVAEILGKSLFDIPIPEQDEAVLQSLFDVRGGASYSPFREVLLRMPAPEKMVHIKVSGNPRYDGEGRFIGYRGTGADVTANEHNKARLAQTEAQLLSRTEQLIEAQKIGLIGDWSYLMGDTHIWWAPHTYELLATNPEQFEPLHEAVLSRYLDDGAERVLRSQAEAIKSGSTKSVDVKVLKFDGTVADFAINSKPIFGDDGKLLGFRGTVQDITARKQAEGQVQKLAYFDPLTSLANRSLFQRELESVIRNSRRNHSDAALLLLDLDRFKEINDAWGHETGDELLRKVAQKLALSLPADTFLARLGGDEFAIIVTKPGSRASLLALADRIGAALSEPLSLQRGEVRVGTSIGIALIPRDGATSIELMRNADMALYEAKEAGRGCYKLFRTEMSEQAESKLSLSRDLWQALDNGQGLTTHFQPQIDLATGHVTGFETLIRWHHPVHGMVPPAQFIPIAESSRLICDLGIWILRKAALQARAWHERGHAWRVSVNVSAAQIWHSDLAGEVAQVLKETGVPARLICLELTESLFADHTEEQLKQALDRLSALGLKLALDDFGTGYSSLGYLRQLPFNEIKIDRIFVSDATHSRRSRNVLEGIIALAHGLNMTTIAEGVEQVEEIELLKEIGCGAVQGYVYSRPQPADEAYAYAQQREIELRRSVA